MNILKGKTVLVTGSTEVIGKQSAYQLGALGATILLHAPSLSMGLPLLNDLRSKFPTASFDLFIANLEVQSEIRQMAADIKSVYPRLDILINNADLLMDERKLTVDTIEKTFAVNHLAPFLVTHLLLLLIKNAANPKIINVSSHPHYKASFNYKNLQGEKYFNGPQVYCFTKLCNLLFTYYLAEKLQNQHINVNAVYPDTNDIYAPETWNSEKIKDCADTIAYLSLSSEEPSVTGLYFVSKLPFQSSWHSYNKKYQRQLWKTSERLTLIDCYDRIWIKENARHARLTAILKGITAVFHKKNKNGKMEKRYPNYLSGKPIFILNDTADSAEASATV